MGGEERRRGEKESSYTVHRFLPTTLLLISTLLKLTLLYCVFMIVHCLCQLERPSCVCLHSDERQAKEAASTSCNERSLVCLMFSLSLSRIFRVYVY